MKAASERSRPNAFQSIGTSSSIARQPAYSWPATLVKVALALLPMEVIAPKHTTTMSANMTAYSTAVGPSSDFKKRLIFEAMFFMESLQKCETTR